MPSRRDLLLNSAAELFSEKGFHGVGIDDIGEAAGITGPGVYRHFPSKQALLETLIDSTMDRMLDLAERAQDLDALVDLHVTLVTEQKLLISVWVREQSALAEDVRRSLRTKMRRYEQVWRDAAAPLRPELEHTELALVVGATLAMLNTSSLIEAPQAQRRAVLRRLAHAALRA
ncbi:MAG: TetR/AcrR family transcriptional regulator [Frankiales bacterium]|nr:TetR/AcrR family transcriptional regulator [Frankiales bacterium]